MHHAHDSLEGAQHVKQHDLNASCILIAKHKVVKIINHSNNFHLNEFLINAETTEKNERN